MQTANAGGPSSVHKLPLVSIPFCILRTALKRCMRNPISLLKPRHVGINIEVNFTYVNLGMLLPFLRNLGSIHGHFIQLCGSLFVRGSFPGDCLQSQLTGLSRIKEAHRFTMKAPNP